MRITAIALGLAASIAFVSPPSFAQSATKAEVPGEVLSDRDIMVQFFLPKKPLVDFISQYCESRYRATLNKDVNLTKFDEDAPGLIDHMVATASSRCSTNFDRHFDTVSDQIADEWMSRVTPSENSRLARLFRSDVAALVAIKPELQPNETAAGAADRVFVTTQDQRKSFQERQSTFAQEPDGIRLLNLVAEYQSTVAAQQDEMQSGIATIVRDAMAEGREAANEFAGRQGVGPIY